MRAIFALAVDPARRHAAAALGCACLLLAACADEGSSATDKAPPEGSGVRLLTFRQAAAEPGRPAPTFHMAAMAGRLALRDGCLVLESGEGRSFALVFREGSARWDAAAGRIEVDGRSFPPGDRVGLGGSGGSAVAAGPDESAAAGCGADALWYVTPGSMAPA